MPVQVRFGRTDSHGNFVSLAQPLLWWESIEHAQNYVESELQGVYGYRWATQVQADKTDDD